MGKGNGAPVVPPPDNHQLQAVVEFELQSKCAEGWNLRVNGRTLESTNPIRTITDGIEWDKSSGKSFISLALGDPAACGSHMRVPDAAVTSLVEVVRNCEHNGYAVSSGLPDCRRAVADHLSEKLPFQLSEQDVIMTAGCNQALQVCLDVLAFDGCNILVPRPGFPIYETYCKFLGVESRGYSLLQEQDWEIDLDQLVELADSNTAAVIVANPGNPCGSVYSYHHVAQIARVAEKLRIPIIADEVYADMAFGGRKFVPMAEFSLVAPVLTVGAVSKRWLAPGWRLGWIAVCDPHHILTKAKVMEGIQKVMQIKLGPSTLVQGAFANLLRNTPKSFYDNSLRLLEEGAELCYQRIRTIPGLDCPSKPQGSMFMMVRINPAVLKGIKDDVEFSSALVKEESVLVLPGSAFKLANWFRILFALPLSEMTEAWDRIEAFCNSRYKASISYTNGTLNCTS
ncbi:hypothetical protein R1flu_005505 [Riccia fluitans]|uniref:Aminotransferase class I/classII large domain-containing protein n=1 Tax=Riccia fluitans TaxID=41844 RepID=A0ABD1YTX3_9MARC